MTVQTEEANRLISHLEFSEVPQTRFSTHLNLIDELAGEAILLTKFNLTPEEGVLNTITLIGVADTRTALANFRDALENHPRYSNVELPISNLAKESNITFTLSLTVNEIKE